MEYNGELMPGKNRLGSRRHPKSRLRPRRFFRMVAAARMQNQQREAL